MSLDELGNGMKSCNRGLKASKRKWAEPVPRITTIILPKVIMTEREGVAANEIENGNVADA